MQSTTAGDIIPLPCNPESIAIGYALRSGTKIAPITSFFPRDMLVEDLPNAITFEKYPDLHKQILNFFTDRLDQARVFRRRLVVPPLAIDRPYCVDDGELDVEYHVRHIALPHPGDWRQLLIQTARIHARPLDRNKPLWEVYVIEGLDNIPGIAPGSFALYIKFHHAAVDGEAGAQITTGFSRNERRIGSPSLFHNWLPPTFWFAQVVRSAKVFGSTAALRLWSAGRTTACEAECSTIPARDSASRRKERIRTIRNSRSSGLATPTR